MRLTSCRRKELPLHPINQILYSACNQDSARMIRCRLVPRNEAQHDPLSKKGFITAKNAWFTGRQSIAMLVYLAQTAIRVEKNIT